MFKKMFMLGAAALLATASTTAMAGSSPITVAKISGAIKVVYTDDGKIEGSTIVRKDGASNKGLIALALGYEPDDKSAQAKLAVKNKVLAAAFNADSFSNVALVVWDTDEEEIVGVLGSVQIAGQPAIAAPPEDTAGKINVYAPAGVSFDDTCFGNSLLSGEGLALLHLTGKVDADNNLIPGAVTLSGLVGSADDAVITDGAFKGNLAKPLATNVSFSCPAN